MARIDHNAKANPIAAVSLLLPSAALTLGFITNNMGRDWKYNRTQRRSSAMIKP